VLRQPNKLRVLTGNLVPPPGGPEDDLRFCNSRHSPPPLVENTVSDSLAPLEGARHRPKMPFRLSQQPPDHKAEVPETAVRARASCTSESHRVPPNRLSRIVSILRIRKPHIGLRKTKLFQILRTGSRASWDGACALSGASGTTPEPCKDLAAHAVGHSPQPPCDGG